MFWPFLLDLTRFIRSIAIAAECALLALTRPAAPPSSSV